LGLEDAAKAHFECAIRFNERMGARPWAALSAFELASILAAAPEAPQRDEFERLVERASSEARLLGMQRLERRCLSCSEKVVRGQVNQ